MSVAEANGGLMEYLTEILSFIAGIFAGGVAMRFHYTRSSRKTTTQTGNVVGGDMAGRDMTKH